MKKIAHILFLFLALSACSSNEKDPEQDIFRFPHLTDENNYPSEYYYAPHDPVRALHPVKAIQNMYNMIVQLNNFNLKPFIESSKPFSKEAPGLRILVDTTSRLSDHTGGRNTTQAIYLLNESDSAIYLDVFATSDMTAPQESYLHMIVEAIDTSGLWRPVEYWDVRSASFNSCMRLPPKSYLITKGNIYMGEYHTQLHYKLKVGGKVYYSSPFPGSVNIDQFNYNWPHITDQRLDFSLSDEFFLRDTL